MLPIITPTDAATLDHLSEQRGVPTAQLMESAGRAVARATASLVGREYGVRAVVVCGKGNNGGDGLVAARYLAAGGCRPTVVLLARPADGTAPAVNLRRYVGSDGRAVAFSPEALTHELSRADVVVDAIFGTGFRGSPEGDFRSAIDLVNRSGRPVVAVDIPSGVEGETGAVRSRAVDADVTVTFGALKPGTVFYPGAALAGAVQVADIGLPMDLVRTDLWLVQREDVQRLLPRRQRDSHKRSTGVVLVIAGSRQMPGAAALTGLSAYRAGAGLVRLATPASVLPTMAGMLREATFLPLDESDEGTVADAAWPAMEEHLASVDAVAVGPGLSRHPSTVRLVRRIAAESAVPTVLDADALNAFEGGASPLSANGANLVLTPHAGELARLTGASSRDISADPVAHARKASAGFGCSVLLKGPRTVVAQPNGTTFVNPTGGPYLATGGSGDVLTGTIAAFLARHLEPSDAAMVAAYVHGDAGRMAAERLGEGTLAGDVAAHLPLAIEHLAGNRG